MRITGNLDSLLPLVSWITTLDGSRTYDSLVEHRPEWRPILEELIRAGCVMQVPEVSSLRDAGVTGIRALGSSSSIAPSDLLAQAASRIIDDLGDDIAPLVLRRMRTRIAVIGSGPFARAVEEQCADAGLSLCDPPSSSRVSGAPETPAAAVIATISHSSEPSLDVRAADAFMRAGIPHICVSVAGSRIACGPWVVPGSSACTRCSVMHLDMPGDPIALAARAIADIGSARPQPASVSTALAASLASARVLAFADGLLESGCAEMVFWDGIASIRTSTVRPHPDCGCISPTKADHRPNPETTSESRARVAAT